MRWRDIRFEKPTEKDRDILTILESGQHHIRVWHCLHGVTAWLPISELRQPDLPGPIPDGWRAVDKAVDAFDTRSMLWLGGKWQPTQAKLAWDRDYYYIVPVNPPAPQYRQFANAAEFMPHRERWVIEDHKVFKVLRYSDEGIETEESIWDYDEALEFGLTFDDGTPFGILINS
jgi:hypothetical protein